MVSLGIAVLLAFLVTASLTPAVRVWAHRRGVVDAPGGRRVHERVTPRLGGLAIFAGFFVPLFALILLRTEVARIFTSQTDRLLGLLLGSCIVIAVGAADDIKSVSPWRKLGAQAVAASIAYYFGYRIEGVSLPFVGDLSLGVLSYFATLFWFLGVTNAINLIDGLDGLAAGVALSACLSNLAIAMLNEVSAATLWSCCLAGALAGFLRHNFNPATIFMGDSGSMFVGFALAATSLAGLAIKGSTAVGILAPMVALGIPIFDTMLAMVRRAVARQPIFKADRSHIHHRLLDLGFTHRRAVLLLYFGSMALAVSAIGLALGRDWQVGIALTVVSVTLALMVRVVGPLRTLRPQDLAPLDESLPPPAPAAAREPSAGRDRSTAELRERTAAKLA